MIPWQHLDSAPVPGSREEIHLHRRGEELSVRIGRDELMNSRVHGSEDALAKIACARVAHRTSPKILIGGLGMGYTLRAALDALGQESEVTVAELVPAVVAWNRGPLADLAGRPLEDRRVTVFEGDVGKLYGQAQRAFDVILLDVDNGPEGFTREANNWIYGRKGLSAAYRALKPKGMLGVWSATPDQAFTRRLKDLRFQVDDLRVPAGKSTGGKNHTIWIATRND